MRGLAIEFPTEHIASSATRQSFTGPLWSPSTSLIAGAHVWPLNNPKIPPGKRSSLSRSTSILRSVLGIWSFDVALLDCSIKPPMFFQTTVVLHASTRFYDRLNNVMKDITDVCRVEMSVKWTQNEVTFNTSTQVVSAFTFLKNSITTSTENHICHVTCHCQGPLHKNAFSAQHIFLLCSRSALFKIISLSVRLQD